MNKFKVISMNVGHTTVRWIDSPWFEEHHLTQTSFVENTVALAVGDFYCCLRNPKDNYKLSNIERLGENEEAVIKYNSTVETLRSNMKEADPIGKIHSDAIRLKITKGKSNEFFKDIRRVSIWLINQKLNSSVNLFPEKKQTTPLPSEIVNSKQRENLKLIQDLKSRSEAHV